jgi:hypothetical protein
MRLAIDVCSTRAVHSSESSALCDLLWKRSDNFGQQSASVSPDTAIYSCYSSSLPVQVAVNEDVDLLSIDTSWAACGVDETRTALVFSEWFAVSMTPLPWMYGYTCSAGSLLGS